MSENEVEYLTPADAAKRARTRKTDPKDISGQAKNMVFTLWVDKMTPSGVKSYDTFIDQVKTYVEDGLISFAAIGPVELAKSTERPHRHGMFCLAESKRFKVIQDKFLLSSSKPVEAIFFMRMEGTPEQAYRYLSKTSMFDNPEGYADSKGKVHAAGTSLEATVVFGDKPKAWKGAGGMEKDRHAEIVRLAESGDLDAIKTVFPDVYLQRYETLNKLAAKKRARTYIKQELPDVRYYYGVSWSGKSTAAFEECKTDEERARIYCKVSGNNDWFDGYDPEFHDTILWDEMAFHKNLNVQVVKQLTTSIQFHAQVKGSSVQCRPGKVIFTSNYHPEAVFLEPADYRAMRNRMSLRYYPISWKKWHSQFPDQESNFYLDFDAGQWPCHATILERLPSRIKKMMAEEEAEFQSPVLFNPPPELHRSVAVELPPVGSSNNPLTIPETPENSTDPSNFVTPIAPYKRKSGSFRPGTPVPEIDLDRPEMGASPPKPDIKVLRRARTIVNLTAQSESDDEVSPTPADAHETDTLPLSE